MKDTLIQGDTTFVYENKKPVEKYVKTIQGKGIYTISQYAMSEKGWILTTDVTYEKITKSLGKVIEISYRTQNGVDKVKDFIHKYSEMIKSKAK